MTVTQPTGQEVLARCGIVRRNKRPCRQPAGLGTDHPGRGPCKWHGGNLPNVRQHYAVDGAQAELRHFGQPLPIEPTDALLWAVMLAARHVEVCSRRVSALEEEELLKSGELAAWVRLQQEAIDRMARHSKAALDAGVAERRVRIAERSGAIIVAAFDSTLGEVLADMAPAERMRLVARFSEALRAGEQSVIEGTASE